MIYSKLFLILTCFIFSVQVSAQFSQFLPKQYISGATSYAQINYSSDATLYAITSVFGMDTTGKATSWFYWFYRPNKSDSGFVVGAIVLVGNPFYVGYRTPNMPGVYLKALGINFCESDAAITAVENAGGRNFRQSHPATRINATVYKIPGTPDTSRAYWSYIYTDTISSQFQIWFVDGVTCQVITIGIEPISTEVPEDFYLFQNYPNPFNPSTKIRFAISRTEKVNIRIYNSIGQLVKILVNEVLHPGIYEVNFDASEFSSGLYFYEMVTEKYRTTKKMLLLK